MLNIRGRSAIAVLAVLCPAAAWANLSSTQTLSANARFSFDTGAVVTSGGDILFTGTSLTLEGSATAYGSLGSGSAVYSSLTQLTLSSLSAVYTSAAIGSVSVNQIIAVHTNGGNYAAVLITAVSSSSLSFQFTTFGVSGGTPPPSGPTVTGLLNNYSNIQPGLPNYGIAPGSIFVIYGTGMSNPAVTTATLQSSTAAGGIPLTLNGASISVTVNGVTTHPGIYYAVPTQIAAVLPSGTPTGQGTITVSYNNVASAAFTIQVVPSAFGLDTVYETGSGLGVGTNSTTYALVNYNASASPGQTINLWGSGLGADTADSDTAYTSTPHAVNTPLQIYIGGILATIGYQGSSGFPGLNQINVTIPTNVQTGCGVSVVAVTGTVVSNTVTIPINPGGGVCSDSAFGITGTQLLSESGQTSTPAYSGGYLSVSRSIYDGMTEGEIGASFLSYPASQTSFTGYTSPSLGNCIVIQAIQTTSTTTPTLPTALDAGTISVTGPAGTQQIPELAIGAYSLQPSSTFLPATFGTFTFTGAGGKNVGPFTVSISYSNPLSWTNMNAITSITRSQGVTVNWTGGASGTYVFIYGGSSNASGSVSVSFECYASVSANQFTIPSYVLLALPTTSSNGSLSVSNYAPSQPFSASGLTTGSASASAGVGFSISPAYQ
jgi:uncharacterized protein (TIGR03437 family)